MYLILSKVLLDFNENMADLRNEFYRILEAMLPSNRNFDLVLGVFECMFLCNIFIL